MPILVGFELAFFKGIGGKNWHAEQGDCDLGRKSLQSSFLPYCTHVAPLANIFVVPQQEVFSQGTILMSISFNLH